MIDQLLVRAHERVDSASITVWRVAFGCLMLIAVVRFFAHGWITEFYVRPDYLFTYPGLSFITPWPGWGMYVHFALLGVLAVLFAAGIAFRMAAALFCLGFTYVELLDQTHYLNHYYLVSLLAGLCAFMPVGRGRESVPRWCLWVLRMQVGLVYVYAGFAKLGSDWLWDAQPLSIWLASNSDFPAIGWLLPEPWIAYVASWSGMVFDITIVVWLSLPRTRRAAFIAVVVFHVMTAGLFNLGLFPWLMIVNATLFFKPSWPRQFLKPSWPRQFLSRWSDDGLRSSQTNTDAVLEDTDSVLISRGRRLAAATLGVYFAAQLVIPFRHLMYPGDVHWTEEGMRFSWKVMVVEKAGLVRFRVVEPKRGRQFLVFPRMYLTSRQEKMMSVQPDMIRQFAVHLADTFERRGYRDVAVFADAFVSLNGRRSQRLIDPNVDLAREPYSFGVYSWILEE